MKMKHQRILKLFSVFLLNVATISLSLAAQYDASEYQSLINEAKAKGFVPVSINLDNTVTLTDMATPQASLNALMNHKAQNVLAELDQHALKSSHWNNGIGQMGVYVNETGLRILADSTKLISFSRDVTRASRIKAVDNDASLAAIETAFLSNSSATVNIFLNTDAVDYEIDALGHTLFKPSSAMSEQALNILTQINNEPFAKGITVTEIDKNRPVIRASIDKNAFYALIERDYVRAIRPIAYQDPRKAQWPEDVLAYAKQYNEAEVVITLRGGEFFSAKTGYMSPVAVTAQANANRRVFEHILAKSGAVALSSSASTSMDVGVLQIKLPFVALAKLYQNADARILSVELNKPVGLLTNIGKTEVLKFSAPAKYCFPQTSVRSELGKFDKVILDHHLIVNAQDHFKTGDIYVGFQRKSQPSKLWLYNGTSWTDAADNSVTGPKAYPVVFPFGDGTLQPVMPITLSNEPIDVSAYHDDGEVWVGYGLKAEGESWKKSYEEMINNRRFNKIWDISGITASSGIQGVLPTICLMTTGLETHILTTGTATKK